MIKNIIIYAAVLIAAFIFNIFYYAWFSWFLLLLTVCIPILSLLISLPFMILSAVNGIIIYCNEEVNVKDSFYIGAAGKKKPTFFCPALKISLLCKNSFANIKSKIKILYGGNLKKPLYKKCSIPASHCGNIEISLQSCRVYDFLGLFFIPIKTDCNCKCTVLPKPKKPSVMPDCEKIPILGYKPKPGGGFSDDYELRQYQSGDSLKNIHWKLSSKSDNLIVREPSQPVIKQFSIRPVFSSDSSDNDSILSRLVYVCKYINKKGSPAIVVCESRGIYCEVSNYSELLVLLNMLYSGLPCKNASSDNNSLLAYSIFPNYEEADRL